jgi:RHS repeat-associated protein
MRVRRTSGRLGRKTVTLIASLGCLFSGLALAASDRPAAADPPGSELILGTLQRGGEVAPDTSSDGGLTVFAEEDAWGCPALIWAYDHGADDSQVLIDSSGYTPGLTGGSQLLVSEDESTVIYHPEYRSEFCGGNTSTPPDLSSGLAAFDLGSDTITPVDVDSSSNPLDSVLPYEFSVTDDGDQVVMTTSDTNVGGTTESDNDYDVVLRDRGAGTTTRINTPASSRDTRHPTIDDDGDWVAVESMQGFGLSADASQTDPDVFVIDAANPSAVVRISKPDGSSTQASLSGGAAESVDPFISGNGRFVAYVSEADNLLGGEGVGVLKTQPKPAVYRSQDRWAVHVHDRDADNDSIMDETGSGEVRTVRVKSGGSRPAEPRLSDDGMTLSFTATNVNETGRWIEVYVRPSATAEYVPTKVLRLDNSALADDDSRVVGSRYSLEGENYSGSIRTSRVGGRTFGWEQLYQERRNSGAYRTVADPVAVASGSLVGLWTDLASPPGVFGLDWTRHYASVSPAVSVLGPGWTSDFDLVVEEQPDGSVDLLDHDGIVTNFDPATSGWERPPEFFGNLVERVDTSLAVEFFDGTVWEFDTDGLLEEMTNWDGQDIDLTRDATTHRLTLAESNAGATLEFTYNGGGFLTEVEASDGRTVTYGYGTSGFLETVTGPGGLVIASYETDGLGRITHEEDGEGNLVHDSVYDDDGRVISQTAPSGGITTFTYDDAASTTTVHDSLTDTTLTYEFNERGQIAQITDAYGKIVTSDYDADGNLLEATSRIGGGVEQTFDPDTGMLLTSTTPGVGTTTYTYDASNRVETVTTPNGTVGGATTTYTYDGTERMPATVTDELSNTWAYDVVDGLVMSMEDPDGVVTDYTYFTNRLLESETRYDGATPMTTMYEYDTQGRLVESTSPEGNVTTRSYTAAGLLDYEISADDGRTDYSYDDAGRVLTITGPELSPTDTRRPVTRYRYNAAGLLWRECVPNPDHTASLIAAGEGCSPDQTGGDWPEALTEYTYDDNGQVTAVEHRDGSTTAYAWGPMGRLLSTTDEEARTTEYEYDDDGNQTVVRDNAGNETETTYDTLGRVDVVADAEDRTTDTDYDTSGRVAEVTDRGSTTTYDYDDLNRVSATTDARGGETVTTYTDGGRVDTVTDAAGVVTTNGYDTAGRLVTKTLSGGRTTTYAYDLDGRMVSVTSPEGNVTATTYDEMGRPLTVADPAGVTTTYTWSQRGLKLSEQLEGQGTASFVYDLADNLVTVTDPLGAATDYAYDSRGRRVSRTDDDGNVETWSYFDDGKIESYTDPLVLVGQDPQTTSYTYDTAGRLATVADPSDRTTTYSYSASGLVTQRLYEMPGMVGTITETHDFGYDAVTGRRTSMTDPSGTSTFSYNTAGDMLAYQRASIVASQNITHRGTAAATNGSGGTSLSIDRPTGTVAGDTLLATVATAAGAPATLLADDFTGTNSDPWNTSKWSTDLSGAGNVDIQANAGRMALAANETWGYALGDTTAEHGDAEATATFSTGSEPDGNVGFWLRASDTWDSGAGGFTDGYKLSLDTSGSGNVIIQLVYDTWNGSWLSGDSFAFEDNTTYRVRFRIEGTVLSAKVWEDGTAEPAEWLLIATDDTHTTGLPAVSVNVNDNAALTTTFDNYQLSEIAPGTSSALADDFTGTNSDPWNTAKWSTALSGSGNVDIQSNAGRMALAANETWGYALGDATADHSDAEVTATFSTGSAPDGNAGFWLRASDTWDSGAGGFTDGYKLSVDTSGSGNVIIQLVYDTWNGSWLSGDSFAFEDNTTYQVRFRIEGTVLSAKVWEDGTTEPAEWLLVATDDTHATGLPAVSVNVNDNAALTTTFDNYQLTALGDTGAAVTPPSGWVLVDEQPGAGVRLSTFTHIAAGGDPSSWSFPLASSVKAAGSITAYSGVDTTDPVDTSTTAANSAGTSHVAPDVTAAGDGSLLVSAVAATGATSFTAPGSMTERADQATSATDAVTVTTADETVDAGATGTRTFTSAAAGASATSSIMLRPVVGADPYAFDVFYTYDTAGRRTSITHPDGTRLGYGYDPTTGRLSTITPSYNLADSFTSVGSAGVDTARWTASGTGSVERADGVAAFAVSNTTGAYATLTAAIADAADVDVAFTAAVPEDLTDVGALNVRLRQSGTDEIRAVLRHDNDDVELVKIDGGVATSLGTVERPDGDTVRLRVRLDGSALKLKAWEPAAAEPAAWGLEVTDADVTAAGDIHVELGRIAGAPTVTIDNVTLVDLDAAPAAVVTYSYDVDDRVIAETLSGGTRDYGYTDSQLTAYEQDLTGTADDLDTTLGYDSSGRIETETTNSVATTYGYDMAGQLLAADDGTSELAWTYDNLGRWATSSRPSGEFSYSYDDADQLTTADCTAGPCVDVDYTYDRAGRRTLEDRGGTGDRAYGYGPTGRLDTTTVTDGTDALTTTRQLDADNHLVALTTDDGTSIEDTWLTWDPQTWRLLETSDGITTQTEHVGAGTGTWAASINAGTVADTARTWSSDIAGVDADPYGLLSAALTGPTLAYRGELHTRDSLIHLRNRDVDPVTGQFTTADPIDGIDGGTTVTSPYHYADNKPIALSDPFGLQPGDCAVNSGPPYFGKCPSRKYFDVPKMPGFGKVVVHVFVEREHDGLGGVEGLGDGRSWKPLASPDESRVHLEVDYESGTGFVNASPSCFWPNNGPEDCRDARPWGSGTFDGKFGAESNKLDVSRKADGEMSIEIIARDTLFHLAPAFNACVSLSAPKDGSIEYSINFDGYPNVEAYQLANGGVENVLQQSSSSNGPIALMRPYCGGPSLGDTVNVGNLKKGLKRVGSWVNPFG